MRTRKNSRSGKKGKTWLIPNDSEKPEDARKVNHNKRGA